MQSRKYIHRIISYLLIFTIVFSLLSNTQKVYAANLKFYNYNTESHVTYTGTQAKYLYNSRPVPLSYPGIIINDTALAAYDELFVQELGLDATLSGNKITICNEIATIVLTLGSKKATVNGKTKTLDAAPVRLKFSDGTEKIYVPTCFVTENLGYSYIWVNNDKTAKITRTFSLSVGTESINYNGSLYSVQYEGQPISTSTLQAFYYQGMVLVPAKEIFEAMGCIYIEEGNTFSLIKEEITLSAELYNKTALVNNKKYMMHIPPVEVTELISGKPAYYIPLEFVAHVLGFEFTYDTTKKQYNLYETEFTGKEEGNAVLEQLGVFPSVITVTPTPTPVPTIIPEQEPKEEFSEILTDSIRGEHFQWTIDVNRTGETDEDYLYHIMAYELENADMIELKGVRKDTLTAIQEGDLLIVELQNVRSALKDQYYSNENNSYFTYALLSNDQTSVRLYFILQPESDWTIFEQQDNMVQIFIKNKEYDISAWMDSLDSTVEGESSDKEQETVNDTIEITVTEETMMENSYPEERLIIPLLADFTGIVEHKDNYLEHNFQLILSGNLMEFYQNNNLLNPYYVIEKYSATYDEVRNATILTFYTRLSCGYQYEKEAEYISVQVARPSEFYSKVVLLDAGHGGTDAGASRKGVKEKNLNFTIMNTYVNELFQNSEIKIYFTRETDVLIDLYDRAEYASELGADMFLSLHMNANNSSSANGTEVYYSPINNTTTASGLSSSILAKHLVDTISNAINTKNKGIRTADFVVVKYNSVPAVLIELGYMTNNSDFAKITNTEYQKKAAQAIYQSVVDILKIYPTGR